MSDFFESIGDYTPTILWMFMWLCAAPIRLLCMLVLPRNADDPYNWSHPVYQFFAFERR
jgi:hypothetical protein